MSTSSDRLSRVTIGKVVGPHGVRGAIRVLPLTDFPERFLGMSELTLSLAGKPAITLRVESVTPHEGKGIFIVEAAGIDDRDAAEALRGRVVTVAPEERVPLPEGEYWIDTLIGMRVIERETGAELGVIEDVMPTGSNDVYSVRTPGGELKVIPATAEVVREIDAEAGEMRVTLIDGLWD